MYGEEPEQLQQPGTREHSRKPKRRLRIEETKGRDAHVVTLSEFVIEILREHLDTQSVFREACGLKPDPQGWMFPQPSTVELWPPAAFSSTFFAFLRRRKLPHLRFHDLRHTSASQSFRVGMSV